MKKVDTRVERNTLALNTLIELLSQIHKSPESFRENKELARSLKSQSSTAGLNISFRMGDTTKSTSPMSLNTLKKYAEKILPMGFDGLNILRVSALEALQAAERREERSNKRTKAGLQKTNMVLLQALNRALDDINSVRDAPSNAIRSLRAAEAIKALSAITSLNAPPFNKLATSNDKAVVKLDEYR